MRPSVKREDRDLLALEELLHDDVRARLAEDPALEHVADGAIGLRRIGADDGPLAGGETVSLDHRPVPQLPDERPGRARIVEGPEARARDPVPREELLGEDLRALQRGRGARWAEDRAAAGLEEIGQAEGERRFRANHRQIDALPIGEIGDRRDVVGPDGHALGDARDAGVARRRVERPEPGALRELPGEGVLAAAAADEENPQTGHPAPARPGRPSAAPVIRASPRSPPPRSPTPARSRPSGCPGPARGSASSADAPPGRPRPARARTRG